VTRSFARNVVPLRKHSARTSHESSNAHDHGTHECRRPRLALPSWRRHLRAADLADRTVPSYLEYASHFVASHRARPLSGGRSAGCPRARAGR
jgi:hypothetical protein